MPATACQLRAVDALYGDPRRLDLGRLQRHHFYELVYVVRGQYRVETLGATWSGGPGWMYCYRPGQIHRSRFHAATAHDSPEAILVQWTQPIKTAPAVYPLAFYDASHRWRHLLSWLLDLHTSETKEDREAANQLLPVLLRELTRAAAHDQSLVPAVNVYISDHLDESIRISDLAESLGLSRSHFSRNFRKLTGQSPQQYVTRTRLKQARMLLSDRSLSLAEIAHRCGFSSPSHLSRVYRLQYKTSPSRDR